MLFVIREADGNSNTSAISFITNCYSLSVMTFAIISSYFFKLIPIINIIVRSYSLSITHFFKLYNILQKNSVICPIFSILISILINIRAYIY